MSRRPDGAPSADLEGGEALVAVCGGIAAYKVCTVVSELVQRGCGVTVAMTQAATRLIGPPTFEALSGRPVLMSMWTPPATSEVQHIRAAEVAHVLLVAPATANVIGKVAGGIADDFVSTLILSAASPVVLAPAMNDRMWQNPAVVANATLLRERGHTFVEPGTGWMACGTVGEGRMAEPREIVDAVAPIIKKRKNRTE